MMRTVAEAARTGRFGRDLIQRIARGEKAALVELYDLTSPMVYGLVHRVVGDAARAEQVTLDVYMQVWRTASSYKPDCGSVNAWLALTARSRALDRLHSYQPTESHEGEVRKASPDSQPSESPILRAIASLPAELREPVQLGFYFGLSHAEIAGQMNLPLTTVKSRIRAGTAKLRDAIGHYLDLEVA